MLRQCSWPETAANTKLSDQVVNQNVKEHGQAGSSWHDCLNGYWYFCPMSLHVICSHANHFVLHAMPRWLVLLCSHAAWLSIYASWWWDICRHLLVAAFAILVHPEHEHVHPPPVFKKYHSVPRVSHFSIFEGLSRVRVFLKFLISCGVVSGSRGKAILDSL